MPLLQQIADSLKKIGVAGTLATKTTTQKQAMRKSCLFARSNLQPLDYRSIVPPLELEKTSPSMLNFGYLNPATCLFYDFGNKSIVIFLMFAGGNPIGPVIQRLRVQFLQEDNFFALLVFM